MNSMLLLWTVIAFLRTCILRHIERVVGNRSLSPRNRQPIRANPKSRHHHSQPKPEWLKREIIRLKAGMPQAGCRTISDICNRRFAASRKVTVGKTFVHRILQRHQYEIQILRQQIKHAKPKHVPSNLIWGLDLTGKTDIKGRQHALLGITDHGSRTLLHLRALRDKTTQTIIHELKQTVRAHGAPKVIRTDCGRVAAQQRDTHRRTPRGCNEGMFRSPAFINALEQLGIRHQRTDPGCPWQNGRVERLFGTLKDKLDQWQVPNFAQLNIDLGGFRYWYNHIRPHQNLDGRTPAEAWQNTDPYTKPPKQEKWFEARDGLLTGYHLRY